MIARPATLVVVDVPTYFNLTIPINYHTFDRFGLESSTSNPLFRVSLDDFSGSSRFRRALSKIHASKASTISILKRSASNLSSQPPTGRPFIRSPAFLTTIGPQLDTSFCWGWPTQSKISHNCNNIVQSFWHLPPQNIRTSSGQTLPNLTSATSMP